jgi:hypothetical protein
VYQAAIDAHPFEPATPPCPWDCGNDDGNVGVNDFLAMIAGWGGPGSCDFDGGGVINVADFLWSCWRTGDRARNDLTLPAAWPLTGS